jgi:hypothetical protein
MSVQLVELQQVIGGGRGTGKATVLVTDACARGVESLEKEI